MGIYNPIAGQSFDSLIDLAKQAGTDGVIVYVAYAATAGDRGGGSYRWDAASTATANGMDIVAVTGQSVGRWVRMKNNNYTTGNVTISLSLAVTTYVVNHNLGFVPSFIGLEATNNVAAVGNRWISNVTSTQFTINYASLLGSLSGNATYSYLAAR